MLPSFISVGIIVLVTSCVFALALASLRYIHHPATRHFVLTSALLTALIIPVARSAIDLKIEVPVVIAPAAMDIAAVNSSQRNSIPFGAIYGLLGLWLVGGLITILPVAGGLIGLARLRRLSAPYTLTIVDMKQLARKFSLRRPVDIRIANSDVVVSAMTWGVLRPVIMLPQEAIFWKNDHFEAILLHELAHIRRHDFLIKLAVRLTCALYWFNPLVWCVARRHGSETEVAADSLAVSTGIRPSIYADALLTAFCRYTRTKGNILAMSHFGDTHIENRVMAVLRDCGGGTANRSIIVAFGTLSATLLAIACLQPAAAQVPPLPAGFAEPVPVPSSDTKGKPDLRTSVDTQADILASRDDKQNERVVPRPSLSPDTRDGTARPTMAPQLNPDSRDYILPDPGDPRLNPDSREYVPPKAIQPSDNPDSLSYLGPQS